MHQLTQSFAASGVAAPAPLAPPSTDRPVVWQEDDGGVVFDVQRMEVDSPYPFEFDGQRVVAILRYDGTVDLYEHA